MPDNKERLISIGEAEAMLVTVDYSKCPNCIHRTNIGNYICRVTAITMINEQGDCIWYEKGNVKDDKGLNFKLAKKRMKSEPIYLSTWEKI